MQECTNFSKIWKPAQNSRYQNSDMKQVSYTGPAVIRCHHTKYSCHSDLAPGICAHLIKCLYIMSNNFFLLTHNTLMIQWQHGFHLKIKQKYIFFYKREITSYCSNNVTQLCETRNAPHGSFWMEFMVKCILYRQWVTEWQCYITTLNSA